MMIDEWAPVGANFGARMLVPAPFGVDVSELFLWTDAGRGYVEIHDFCAKGVSDESDGLLVRSKTVTRSAIQELKLQLAAIGFWELKSVLPEENSVDAVSRVIAFRNKRFHSVKRYDFENDIYKICHQWNRWARTFDLDLGSILTC